MKVPRDSVAAGLRSDDRRQPAALSMVLRSTFHSRRGRLGFILALTVVLLTLIGPLLAPHGTTEFIGTPFETPRGDAWLGTDVIGRDVLSRFLLGGQRILLLSLLSTALGVGSGVLLGVLAAYSKPWVDEGVMRPLDIVLSFPQLILVLLFVSLLGARSWLIVFVVAIAHAPQVARVIRGATLAVRHRDFVKYAEALGLPRWRIVVSELIPNVSSPALVEFGLRLTYSIGIITSLNFLGLGAQPPQADWGLMMSENRAGLLLGRPLGVVVPALVVALVTIGLNLMTDSVARAAIGIERAEATSAENESLASVEGGPLRTG